MLRNILTIPGIMSEALDLYNSSEYTRAREKLYQILEMYPSDYVPATGIEAFDTVVLRTSQKTQGLIHAALANCEFFLGNIDTGLAHNDEAHAIGDETGDPQLLKIALADRGNMEMNLGNYYTALNLIKQALAIDDTSHDPWRKRNRTLLNLGILYSKIGNNEKALQYMEEALQCAADEGDAIGRAKILNGKGVALAEEGEFEASHQSLQEALNLSAIELKNHDLQGLVLNNLAHLFYDTSQSDKARHYFNKALELAHTTSDPSLEGFAHTGIAIVDLENGDFDNARNHARMALEASLKSRNCSGQGDAHFILGVIAEQGFNDLDKAFECYTAAIDISETLRENAGLDEFKISFAGTNRELYQRMVNLCVSMGRTADAFHYVERSKSRALVDMLSHAIDVLPTNDTFDDLTVIRAQLEQLRREMAAPHLTLVRGKKADSPATTRTGETNDIERLEETYKRTFEHLKKEDPEWSSLVSVDAVSADRATAIIGPGSALLDFFQTAGELVVICITKNREPAIVRIPCDPDTVSETVFSVLGALSSASVTDVRSHDYIRDIRQPLSLLYDLLVPPLRPYLTDIHHLIISPHSFWHYLPFPALFNGQERRYLVDEFSLSVTPSATVLSFCMDNENRRRRTSGTTQKSGALVLANPTRDLPFAGEEADRISVILRSKGRDCSVFTGSDATYGRLSGAESPELIHLACHGYFGDNNNPLFSCIVLSDEEGNESPHYVPDIFSLKLDTALVTLSACETGLSQCTSGDELLGLTRAFFYAGTPAIVATLWPVNDRSTAVFMENFYGLMIRDGKGRAQALCEAMRRTKATGDYAHPCFWAPFFLSGDWR